MKNLSPVIRIALGLVGLLTSLVLVASTIGLFPDTRTDIISHRKQMCESLAISFSTLANHLSKSNLEKTFQQVVDRSKDVQSIGVRLENGTMLFEVGEHTSNWRQSNSAHSSESEVNVPIYKANGLFGRLEVRFLPIQADGIAGYVKSPEFSFAAFMAIAGWLTFYVYLRFVLTQLNPSKAVPKRVREALDTLAEGLLILDNQERIVLANDAFQRVTGLSHEKLLGKQATDIPFESRDESTSASQTWESALTRGTAVRGHLLGLDVPNTGSATFSVSCSPIVDDDGGNRGAIASFEDVTQLEQQKTELQQIVKQLNESSSEIKRKNRELEILATRDVLTGCFNRRSLFEEFDAQWAAADVNGAPLSVFMVDIDNFKSINDTHGHAVGDEVLRRVGKALENTVRPGDTVSRYGGEEFAILLPNTSIETAHRRAEDIRVALETLEFPQLSITASIGLSAISEGARAPQELLEQADKCLYVAKRNGRNQVVGWDKVAAEIAVASPQIMHVNSDDTRTTSIPFHAVTALISALAYRDRETANHSRRVADLCVAVAEGLLPMKDCYILEIAGLLHDIGKIGLPDSILLKSDELTTAELEVMRRHEKLGVELIDTSFACTQLTEIVSQYWRQHDQDGYCNSGGKGIPIGSRILSIADAYDSMVSHSHQRPPKTQDAALEELRGRAGEQFDPELVERFIHVVKLRGTQHTDSVPLVSKEAALSIGLQMERLAAALDARDSIGIAAIASRLHATTENQGVIGIPEKAAQIAAMSNGESDLFEMVQTANELLDLCRLSQRSLLTVAEVNA